MKLESTLPTDSAAAATTSRLCRAHSASPELSRNHSSLQQRIPVQVLTHTDHAVGDHETLSPHVRTLVAAALKHCRHPITRVEAQLGEKNGAKGGPDDKRCLLEARFEGRKPLVVTH